MWSIHDVFHYDSDTCWTENTFENTFETYAVISKPVRFFFKKKDYVGSIALQFSCQIDTFTIRIDFLQADLHGTTLSHTTSLLKAHDMI